MHEQPNGQNTLYLPIKQVYFDQIVAGTKKCEYREVKEGITANRYLQKTADGKYALNPECTTPGRDYYIDDYNDGRFPFLPKQSIKYLNLAVGYARDRDTAIVEVTGFSFEPKMVRGNLYAFWVIVFHLGQVIEICGKSGRFNIPPASSPLPNELPCRMPM